MATNQTVQHVVQLLFDAPLANKPRPTAGQTDADVLAATARVFALTLRDVDDELLKAAVVQHIATQKWFPAVADLRTAAVSLLHRVDDVPDVYTAWQQIKRRLRGGPPPHALAERAIDALGGIAEFGQSHVDDEPSWRARFVSAYETLQQRQAEDAMMLPQIAGYVARQRALSAGNTAQDLIASTARALSAGPQPAGRRETSSNDSSNGRSLPERSWPGNQQYPGDARDVE